MLSLRSGCKSEAGLYRSAFNETLPLRFARKCGAPDANGCIPWLGSATSKGYGIFWYGSEGQKRLKTTAHRLAWALKNGDIAPGLLVLHSCDNPRCVNLAHLSIGTPQNNTDDMVSKRRHAWRERTPWQKLNATDGERIRDLRRTGCTQQQVADWFGVSRPLISLIESGKIQHSAPARVSI